ncbi:hypothetical protein DFH94DRAFT_11044 [Russula ochroleuca]|uniref:Uncharacterized protein n=1 Tax=Russula ochroleuca TaxID=152965 RepID=A0A9P5N5W7_9AGAM|nr:hypothetical protein DFH94DRAFT_11044 [Russula ochroleuca]
MRKMTSEERRERQLIRRWALWLLYSYLWLRCGLTSVPVPSAGASESEDVSFCLLSDPLTVLFRLLYMGHTSRIHLGTRHKNRPSTATYRIGACHRPCWAVH